MRHWIRSGLVPKPLGRGPAARYSEDALTRVRAIQTMRAQHQGLPDIRARFAASTEEQIAALVPPPPRPTMAEGVPVPPAPVNYPSTPYEVVVITDHVLLMVRTDKGELPRRIANEIVRHYGPVR
jgi:hypothetical protein